LIIFSALDVAAFWVLGHFIQLKTTGAIPPLDVFLIECTQMLVLLVAVLAMARLEKQQLRVYGYADDHRAIRLVSGAVWGFAAVSLLVGTLWANGLLVYDGQATSGIEAWQYALEWGIIFLLVGAYEESLLRGYLQFTIARGIGFWWAALLLSTAFGVAHMAQNSNESALGVATAGGAGLLFCLSLWYTKSLWWAIGCHFGWNWGQTYLYGTPDSGKILEGHLLTTHPIGDPLWSGGSVGPEGSVLVLPLLMLAAAGMWMYWGKKKPR
jgi:membrane protease YdiL (CAAX protease family)